MAAIPMAALAQDYTYTTNADGRTITITGYDGAGGTVVVPGTIDGFTVTVIGGYAFENFSSLTGVTIPASVTSIGDDAFAFTGLTSVAIPNGVVTIGEAVFTACSSLASITVGSGVTHIDDYAFAYCPALATVLFEGDAPAVGSDLFDSDNNVMVYYLPETSGWDSTLDGVPVMPVTLMIQTGDGSFGAVSNQFGFNISGPTSFMVTIEATTDFTGSNWSPLQTVTLTNGSYYFSEPWQPNASARFYRLQLQ